METKELKFLIMLLGCENYRSSLSANSFKDLKGKEKICRDLSDRQLIDFSREIATVKILPPGEALLNDPAQSPITDKELRVLDKISKASGKISPSEIKSSSLKAAEKEAILTTLSEREFIEVETRMKKAKAEVWITQQGIEYLRDDYNPQGNAILSLDLVGNYLRFLRKYLPSKPDQGVNLAATNGQSPTVTIANLTDEEILETIQKLDQELGTENYLPIFHLREKLQPPLSRDELDKALYRLEEAEQIELNILEEPGDYTPEQLEAGISENGEDSLFFITVD
ncbi:MAG: transcription factor RcaD [Stigonema ocellatum SAG 48.90 = DSM 106950]|nr:transcription factor RcaD [Stigonema ocellatum SAG 48.90 = DSM 106950]